MFQADKANREIISDLLRLRCSLSAYVSSEDIKKIGNAEKAFDSGQIDNDGLLAIVCSARQKAEERFAKKAKLREDLQQAIQQILDKTNNWPLNLRAGIKDRCEEEQSWLNEQLGKNDELPTGNDITANTDTEVEDMKSRLNSTCDRKQCQREPRLKVTGSAYVHAQPDANGYHVIEPDHQSSLITTHPDIISQQRLFLNQFRVHSALLNKLRADPIRLRENLSSFQSMKRVYAKWARLFLNQFRVHSALLNKVIGFLAASLTKSLSSLEDDD
ncbi:unnamed protein product [Calicophoron daubneyi]|uniref:Uncharacterized protein n=1 Tax=Calicophoron daubneyi TaxID=300641 RepID=A0AAV2T070_CALDB